MIQTRYQQMDSCFMVVQLCNHLYDYGPNGTSLTPTTIIK